MVEAGGGGSVTPDRIDAVRAAQVGSADLYLSDADIEHTQVEAVAVDGAAIVLSVFRRRDHLHGPGIFYIHGGGMIAGNRFTGLVPAIEWVREHDAVLVSVEYRLAPEHPYPTPFEDCYAGLLWTIEHSDKLGYDPDRLVIAGTSAGGGLAAGAALRLRDEGNAALAAQILICPMLDDRNETVSSRQIDGLGLWDRASNQTGWEAYLGELSGSDQVASYAAPARATDFSGLPPTFLDCGSSEVFRDEIVAYASALWAAGGQAELHVWPGGFHGFDKFVPHAALSRAAHETRSRWFRRNLTTDH
jgi:acetyl esterase/lipase